jgi:hypothetical protein
LQRGNFMYIICYTRDMRRLHATLLHTIEPLNV